MSFEDRNNKKFPKFVNVRAFIACVATVSVGLSAQNVELVFFACPNLRAAKTEAENSSFPQKTPTKETFATQAKAVISRRPRSSWRQKPPNLKFIHGATINDEKPEIAMRLENEKVLTILDGKFKTFF